MTDFVQHQISDWSTKTDFSDISTIGYLCDNGIVISGQISRKTKAKIFVNFGKRVEEFGAAYSWIDIPNDRLCPPPLISSIKNDSGKEKKKRCHTLIKPKLPIKFKYYTNPVRISNNEFVIAIPSIKQLIKYNVHSKRWSEFNYDVNRDKELGDWTKRRNFQQLESVGYLLDNGDIITGQLVKVHKDKIFIHFNQETAPFKYSWINIPNKRLSAPQSVSADKNAKLYYDDINDEYYIYDNKRLTMINIKNNTTELISDCPSNFDSYTILIQGQFHLISSNKKKYDAKYHNIFDPKTKTMETNVVCCNFDKFIHIPSKHILLLFGKTKTWRYSLKDKLLTNDATLDGIYIYGKYDVLLTNNQQYVLIVDKGGITHYLDLNTMKVFKINIEWNEPEYVIIMGNDATLITSIYGFTRNVWKMNDMESLFPSHDILGLIVLFVRSEFIHLLKNKRHSIINIIDVIPSYYSLETN